VAAVGIDQNFVDAGSPHRRHWRGDHHDEVKPAPQDERQVISLRAPTAFAALTFDRRAYTEDRLPRS
jgi:hypothetical protein